MRIDKGRWPKPVTRFWSYVNKGEDDCCSCWEWTSWTQTTGYPYGRFRFNESGRQRRVAAHRYAWEITNGPIPDGLCVCHRCDNPKCVRPDHLFLGTMADNSHDRDLKGRARLPATQRGERHHLAKITAEQAKEIFTRAVSGESQASLAREFGIDPSGVSLIKTRRTWRGATESACAD